MKARSGSVTRARELRRVATEAEKALWEELRDRKLGGFKFRRQVPVGAFVLDLYCAQSRLAVEVDGGGHAEAQQAAYDDERTQLLARRGIRLLRFWNDDVMRHREAVLERILRELEGGSSRDGEES